MDEEFQISNFMNEWNKSSKNIFRLEALPEYNVGEDEIIDKFRKGENIELPDQIKDWLKIQSETIKKGISLKRVRIIPNPIPEYIKFEIHMWNKFSKLSKGEEFYFLKEEYYEKIISKIDFVPKDFWMFDDNTIIIFNYKKNGEWIGEELIQDKTVVEKYKKLKYKLLDLSIPMNDFLKNIEATVN